MFSKDRRYEGFPFIDPHKVKEEENRKEEEKERG
jgi:hypothetical protein